MYPTQDLTSIDRGFQPPIFLKAQEGKPDERKKLISDYINNHKDLLTPNETTYLEVKYETHKSKGSVQLKNIKLEVRLNDEGIITIKELKKNDMRDSEVVFNMEFDSIGQRMTKINKDIANEKFDKENANDLLSTIEYAIQENKVNLIEKKLNPENLIKIAFSYPTFNFFETIMKIPSIKAAWDTSKSDLSDDLIFRACMNPGNISGIKKINLLFPEDASIKIQNPRHGDLSNCLEEVLKSGNTPFVEFLLNKMDAKDRYAASFHGVVSSIVNIELVNLSSMSLLTKTLWGLRGGQNSTTDS